MARTARDLKELTGLGINSVYAGIKTGELPGYYVGSRVVIPDEAFEAFKRGEWVPKPRPYFANPVRALPQPEDLLKRVG